MSYAEKAAQPASTTVASAPAGVGKGLKPLFVTADSSRSPTWIETQLWGFLQWYTSFFYWGTGVSLGLLQGYVYFLSTYCAQLLVDTLDLFRLRTPAFIEKAAEGRVGAQPTPDLHHSALTETAKEKLSSALAKEEDTMPRECPRPQTTPKKKSTASKTPATTPVSSS